MSDPPTEEPPTVPTISIVSLRRRRGVVRASVTRLATRLNALESKSEEPTTIGVAQRMSERLASLDDDFKAHHFAVVDTLEEEDDEGADAEQDVLDKHDDDVASLALRIDRLNKLSSSAAGSGARSVAARRLSQFKDRLAAVNAAVTTLTGDAKEIHLVYLYQEQLSDFKKELGDIRHDVASKCTPEEAGELDVTISTLDKEPFDLSLVIKRHLYSPVAVPDTPHPTRAEPKGVRLPKLEVPVFDGEILRWQTFWEQFCVAIHDRTDISDTEKLVYLRHAIKDGTAKNVIEGLSRSGEHYAEAIGCLKTRYNRPRLIHQTHVRRISEFPALRDGSGKELRRLHDTVLQHLRALKSIGHEPSGSFITSLLELKLDQNTMFEWQKFSHDCVDVPHYTKFLEFLNLRAQASETCSSEIKKNPRIESHPARKHQFSKHVASFAANAAEPASNCVLCTTEKHPLYVCPRFKVLPHDKMLSTIQNNKLCMNCLRPGHFSRQCGSLNRCRKCQKPHHTLLHDETKGKGQGEQPSVAPAVEPVISSNAATGITSNTLLMTCVLVVCAPDGTSVKARCLLDSASSTSFVSERLVQALHLPRVSQNLSISGVAGLSHHSPLQSITNFEVFSVSRPAKKFQVSAVVTPRVTSDLPTTPVSFSSKWRHLSGLQLADPNFGRPGRIDVLLGVDIYADALLQGRRSGPPGTPTAFETTFGWVLVGKTDTPVPPHICATSHHVAVASGDELLRKFWEIEESPNDTNLSPEERAVVQHFEKNHTRDESGRFVVPLPKNAQSKPLGESRSQAVRRFLSLERSLRSKNQFQDFAAVMEEYFEMDHAELVPVADLQKPPKDVFYLPMHAVRKEHSTTTKIRTVFDASAKSTTGVSLNDTLLVGPTVNPTLIDVLLRFRFYRVALTADVSKMYRAVELVQADRDLHRFVWRNDPDEPLLDYRMTRVTFGVSASSFAANMAVKQNATDFAVEFPLAANIVKKSFYVDDCLAGADSVQEAIEVQKELQSLFSRGDFLLRKWNSNDPCVLEHLSPDLKDSQPKHLMPDTCTSEYTKTLGFEWNVSTDHFRLTIPDPLPPGNLTKRALVSDIAKTFDVLGLFSPSTIKMKILLQQLWEEKVDWDDTCPSSIHDVWLRWRSELRVLSEKHIPRCYFDKSSRITSIELHGFSDASELAYAAVVYLRLTTSDNDV